MAEDSEGRTFEFDPSVEPSLFNSTELRRIDIKLQKEKAVLSVGVAAVEPNHVCAWCASAATSRALLPIPCGKRNTDVSRVVVSRMSQVLMATVPHLVAV